VSYRIAADAVLLLHLGFIAFVVLGALLALRWRWVMFVQVPAAVWGAFVELTGRICPLTVIENRLRVDAGATGYGESFIEHYLLAVIYPGGLTRHAQWILAAVVLAVNGAIYARMLRRSATAAPPRATIADPPRFRKRDEHRSHRPRRHDRPGRRRDL